MTAVAVAVMGGVAVTLAALLLYLAAPHQQWGTLPVRPAVCGWGGAVLLLFGTLCLLCWAGPATAIFVVLTLVMTVCSIVPVAIGWWRSRAGGTAR